jgi:hypothetical protein
VPSLAGFIAGRRFTRPATDDPNELSEQHIRDTNDNWRQPVAINARLSGLRLGLWRSKTADSRAIASSGRAVTPGDSLSGSLSAVGRPPVRFLP